MSREGDNIQSLLILLNRFTSSGQWDRVLATANELLACDPENTRGHMSAGQALINLQRYAEGETHLAKVLAAEPRNDIAHRLMSIAQFKQNRFKAADESIHKAISLNPNSAYHWFHLANMFYRQNDLVMAKKYAEKARELSPREPDIINLIALCEPKGGFGLSLRLRGYREALELDPENPQVHNNLGVYHLNEKNDLREAERCFRRALFFQPTMKTARKNLFLTLKHRDPVYRKLCAPKDFILRLFSRMGAKRRQNLLLYILLLPLWLLAFRFMIAAIALWLLFVWPLVKAYEYLTIGDIRNQAGEIGARRGGIFGYRRWPLKVRLAIFALLLIGLWGGIALLVLKSDVSNDAHGFDFLLGAALIIGLLYLLAVWAAKKFKQAQLNSHARRRAKQFQNVAGAGTPPKITS